MMLAGLKLGGMERGGYSLNVAANLKTSSITPYMLPTWLMLPVPEGVGGDVGPLEGVLHEVEDLLQAQRRERLGPDAHRALPCAARRRRTCSRPAA